MQCGTLDKTRDAATAQNNPGLRWGRSAFRVRCDACEMSHIALRTAPARNADLHPSNDSVWSRTALVVSSQEVVHSIPL